MRVDGKDFQGPNGRKKIDAENLSAKVGFGTCQEVCFGPSKRCDCVGLVQSTKSVGNGPNTVSGSTVSNTERCWAH